MPLPQVERPFATLRKCVNTWKTIVWELTEPCFDSVPSGAMMMHSMTPCYKVILPA